MGRFGVKCWTARPILFLSCTIRIVFASGSPSRCVCLLDAVSVCKVGVSLGRDSSLHKTTVGFRRPRDGFPASAVFTALAARGWSRVPGPREFKRKLLFSVPFGEFSVERPTSLA